MEENLLGNNTHSSRDIPKAKELPCEYRLRIVEELKVGNTEEK